MAKSYTCEKSTSFEERDQPEGHRCLHNTVTRQNSVLLVSVVSGVAQNLAVPGLIGIWFVERFLKRFLPPRQKVVLFKYNRQPRLAFKNLPE